MMEVDSPEMMNEQVEKLFTHKLTDAERKTLEAIKRELDADFERRCKMLMDRLEVTSMAFAASSKLIDKEDEFKQVYSAAKEAIVVPKPASMDDLMNATTNMLKIEKTVGTAKTKIHQYMMKEVPPSRGGNQKFMAADTSSSRFPKRGGYSKRGRGGSGGSESLQSQIHQEINRQLNVSEGPYHKDAKRGKGGKKR